MGFHYLPPWGLGQTAAFTSSAGGDASRGPAAPHCPPFSCRGSSLAAQGLILLEQLRTLPSEMKNVEYLKFPLTHSWKKHINL